MKSAFSLMFPALCFLGEWKPNPAPLPRPSKPCSDARSEWFSSASFRSLLPPQIFGACVWLIRRGWSSVCSSFPQPRSFARRDRQRSQELAAKAAQVLSPCLLHTRSLAPWCNPERSRATESNDKIQGREEDAGGAVMWHLHAYLPGIYSRSRKENPDLRVIQEQQQVPET